MRAVTNRTVTLITSCTLSLSLNTVYFLSHFVSCPAPVLLFLSPLLHFSSSFSVANWPALKGKQMTSWCCFSFNHNVLSQFQSSDVASQALHLHGKILAWMSFACLKKWNWTLDSLNRKSRCLVQWQATTEHYATVLSLQSGWPKVVCGIGSFVWILHQCTQFISICKLNLFLCLSVFLFLYLSLSLFAFSSI